MNVPFSLVWHTSQRLLSKVWTRFAQLEQARICYTGSMHARPLVWVGFFVGSTIGSLLPSLWGGDAFSFSSILLSGLVGIAGIYVGFKMSD